MANWEGADMMTTGAMVTSENWSNVMHLNPIQLSNIWPKQKQI